MDSISIIPLISLVLSIIVGSIGTFMMLSLNKKILSSIGLKKLPKDPHERYTLLVKHCKFLGRWTKFDKFNLYILLFGILFIIAAGGITIFNMETGGTLFLDRLQLGLIINSFAWIFLSSFLMVGRFIQVMNLYKYK